MVFLDNNIRGWGWGWGWGWAQPQPQPQPHDISILKIIANCIYLIFFKCHFYIFD